jgi:hypothetical protein
MWLGWFRNIRNILRTLLKTAPGTTSAYQTALARAAIVAAFCVANALRLIIEN